LLLLLLQFEQLTLLHQRSSSGSCITAGSRCGSSSTAPLPQAQAATAGSTALAAAAASDNAAAAAVGGSGKLRVGTPSRLTIHCTM
jgi:hypothetical protein